MVFEADGFTLDNFKTQKPAGVDTMHLDKVTGFTVHDSPGLADRNSVTVAKAKE